MKILNFGSCNIDTVYNVSNIVRPGETMGAVSVKKFPGGKGLNQSIAVAKAGVPVYHAGCIGENDLKTLSVLKMAGLIQQILKEWKSRQDKHLFKST